eukprot:8722752-Pyramimonas_sp.AAC.1
MSQAKREACRGRLKRNKQILEDASSKARDLSRLSQADREICSRMPHAKQEIARGCERGDGGDRGRGGGGAAAGGAGGGGGGGRGGGGGGAGAGAGAF